MFKIVERFERFILFFLLFLMMITVALATGELVWILFKEIIKPPFLLLDLYKLLEIFGFFMMILIGIELIYSIKTYLKNQKVQVEIVLVVAIIAIARKIIILDSKNMDGLTLLGLGGLVIALAAGYFLIRTVDLKKPLNIDNAEDV
jgi:uncharacterized membrane protein (DUF373 family)